MKPITFVGPSDDGAYGILGDCLVNGRGLSVNYISFFFIPIFAGDYAQARVIIGRRSWDLRLRRVFMRGGGRRRGWRSCCGDDVWVDWVAVGDGAVGVCAEQAGVCGDHRGAVDELTEVHPYIYEQSLRTLSDVSTAMLIAGFAGSILLAQRWRWMFVLAGVFAGLGYYSKGSEILLLGLFPVMAVLACGWRSLKSGWFYGGFLTAVLVMAPFWYSNYRLFGNPLHSTQNYVSGYFSLGDWESETYRPYWGIHPPKTSDRWTKYKSVYWRSSSEQMETLGLTALTGVLNGPNVWGDFGGWGYWARDFLDGEWARVNGPFWLAHMFGWEGRLDPAKASAANLKNRREYLQKGWDKPMKAVKEWQYPAWELAAAGAALLCGWVLLTLPWAVFVWVHRWMGRRSGRASVRPLSAKDNPKRRLLIGPVAAVCLLFAVQFVFLSYFWAIRSRFVFTFLPLLAALGVTGFAHFAELPLQGVFAGMRAVMGRMKAKGKWVAVMDAVGPYGHVVLTIVFAAGLMVYAHPLQAQYARWLDTNMNRGGYPFEDELLYATMGKWVNKNVPNAVIMSHDPWELTFYTPNSKGTTFPNPDDDGQEGARQIFAIARYYGVTHIWMDIQRQPLLPYMEGRIPGFKRMKGAPGAFFEVDWSKIPAEWTVENVFGKGAGKKP